MGNATQTYREAAAHRRTLHTRIEHPLGVGAKPGQDHRTEANRRALAHCLYSYFDGTLTDQITKAAGQGDAAVGLPLGDRMVSRLEISAALDQLKATRADLYSYVWQAYHQRRTRKAIARRTNRNVDTVSKYIEEALHFLIDVIWFDLAVAEGDEQTPLPGDIKARSFR